MKNIVKPIYYLLMFLFLLSLSIAAPLKLAERAETNSVNAELDALKKEIGSPYLDLKDSRVKEALNAGNEMLEEKYKHYSSLLGLLASVIALGVAYFFKYASRYDPIYILALFALLFALGSIKAEYFAVIAVLSFAAFYLKSRKTKPPPTDNLPTA